MNLFQRITRGADEALLYQSGTLNQNGRLTDDGLRDVVDLLFLGKKPDEIRTLLIEEAKKYVQESK